LKFIPNAGHYSYGTDPDSSVQAQAEVLTFVLRAMRLPVP
jgi:hypothetical protein